MSAGVVPFVDVFTGSSAATWTLPAVADNAGQVRIIGNRGTANLSVTTTPATTIWTNQAGATIVIPPNSSRTLVSDGTYWYVDGPLDGLALGEQLITQNAPYTLTSQTAVQPIFNTGAGFVAILPGNYFFEGLVTLSSLSATSGAFGFALGAYYGLTIAGCAWDSVGNKAALSTAATPQATCNTAAANTAVVSATTGTDGWMRVRGKIRASTNGALRPEVSLGVAAAAVVGADSYFRLWTAGLAATTTVGAWG